MATASRPSPRVVRNLAAAIGVPSVACVPGATARAQAVFRYQEDGQWQSITVTTAPLTLTEDLCGNGATPVALGPSPSAVPTLERALQ